MPDPTPLPVRIVEWGLLDPETLAQNAEDLARLAIFVAGMGLFITIFLLAAILVSGGLRRR